MKWITKNEKGQVFLTDERGNQILANPQIIRETNNVRKSNSTPTETEYKFKLLTARKLSNKSEAEVTRLLNETQKKLENAALVSGQPALFPVELKGDPSTYIGIYIDEDIYPENPPIYTYESIDSNLKAFVLATGTGKDDYDFHICHTISSTELPDGNLKFQWRLFSKYSDGQQFLLDNSTLPECFSINYSPRFINYIGGGTWHCLAVEEDDKIPVVDILPRGTFALYGNRYKPYGEDSPTNRKRIIAQATTPSYSFTWSKGISKLSRRNREASENLNLDIFKDTNVITIDKSSQYYLDLYLRVEDENSSTLPFVKQEYSVNNATYVANTNLPIVSPFQFPDYGTDYPRMSLKNYYQDTNVIRPYNTELSLSNSDRAILNTIGPTGCVCSDRYHSNFIYLDLGRATGSIYHPDQIKSSIGHREYSSFYYYKNWFVHGKVLQFEAINDTDLYVRSRLTGELFKVGNFSELGELIQGEKANYVTTTWEAPPTPSGFFAVREGRFEFLITYSNPPLLGHQGPFYYHINPVSSNFQNFVPYKEKEISYVDYSAGFTGLGGSFFSGQSDPRLRANELISTYTQMLGGLAGVAVPSLNIGNINIADKDSASLIIRQPTEDQKETLDNIPHVFPNGFWDGLISVNYNNENIGSLIKYDSDGNAIEAYSI